MPESDAGWQKHEELLGKPWALESECTIYGDRVFVVYHWEDISFGPTIQEEVIPVIDAAFVGDEQKLFDVTNLIDDACENTITSTLEAQRKEDREEVLIERQKRAGEYYG